MELFEAAENVGDSVLQSELLMLDSIYPSEYDYRKMSANSSAETLLSSYSAEFSMLLMPATAGDISQQNISVVLQLFLPHDYPESVPVICFKKPRGLSDIQLSGLKTMLEGEMFSRRGSAMIFDLIDILRDYLTRTNFPSVQCPFCLCDIEEGDEFFKSDCCHYCHMFCLRKYVDFIKSRPAEYEAAAITSCIVCRTSFCRPVILETSVGLCEPGSVAIIPETFTASDEILKTVEWRRLMFEHQKAIHGLIEPQPEERVITLNHIPEIDRLGQLDVRP